MSAEPQQPFLLFDRRTQEERSYWLQKLTGAVTERSGLPLDFPRPPGGDADRGRLDLRLGDSTLEALGKVTSGKPFLEYTALMTALKVCLFRCTKEAVSAVGSPARQEGDPVVNAVTILDQIDGRSSFRQTLLQVRQSLLDAYARQGYPFARLVEDLGLEAGGARCPLFDVALSYEELHGPLPEVHADVLIHLRKEDGRLAGEIRFRKALFRSDTVARFGRLFLRLLEQGLREIEAPVASLCVLGEAERHQVLLEWNDSSAPVSGGCLHEIFEGWAERTPDAVAVTSEEGSLSYAELNRRANRLAACLLARGLKPEARVGIYLNRSPEMIQAVLGILKAGGAYVPFDPAHPEERLTRMIEDAEVSLVLTKESLGAGLRNTGVSTVCLDRDASAIAACPDSNPGLEIDPARLAYVIFTSGSTGRPKGALLAHGGLSNLAGSKATRVDPGGLVLQFASLSFDASVYDIAMAFDVGAGLCLAPPHSQVTGLSLLRLCRAEGVTTATLPPSLVAALPEEDLPRLRTLAVAGEACPEDLPARWGRDRLFLNAYGPTEATVCSTRGICSPDSRDRPSIGRAIANVQVYVLDSAFEPVPIGCPGELYVGGAGVGRGYVKAPDLTAERFLPDSFGGVPGARLYRTGDLCRWLPAGVLDFLGRIDRQVKIRGFRIELGEIEASLAGHPEVRSCVVTVREDRTGGPELAAYYVPRSAGAAGVEELRTHLRLRLPEHMVPATFTEMEALPLNLSGKVDLKALPAPDDPGAAGEQEGGAPRNPVEEVLAGIFASLLKRERIGIHGNFFDLGGHSLLATQAVSRACEALRVDLSLRDLFDAPSVAGLAERVSGLLAGGTASPAPPIHRVLRDGGSVLSFSQQRLWFLDRFDPGSPVYNLAVPLRLGGRLWPGALRRSLDELVRRHEVLRTVFDFVDGEPLQRVLPFAPVPQPLVDLGALPPEAREREALRIAEAEAARPFDLARGPVFRTVLLRLDREEHVLLCTLHHIAGDAWSLDILVRDAAELYGAFIEDRPPELPGLDVQYADFAVWQREWLRGDVLARELAYWRERLAGAPALALPTDRPLPPVQTFRGDGYAWRLPGPLSQRLHEVGRQAGATPFMTLLAAFQALLSRYAGQEDVSVGTPVSGRNHREIENLIGFFLNTLVVRTDLSGAPTFQELLGRVRDVVLGAFLHQELPFDKLVEELQPPRNLGQTPLFQAMFVFQRQAEPALDLPGLSLSPIKIGTRTAKFSLTLATVEGADGVGCFAEYNRDLFDAGTMERLAGHFDVLVQAMTEPDRRLSEVALLTEGERVQLLGEWNATRAPRRRGCVHVWIEERTDLDPSARAVLAGVAGEERLTYGELEARANRLARYLRRLEVRPGVLVGLCLERSTDTLVAMLGILKAGGAYVPLDPAQPLERRLAILEEARPDVLVTQEALASDLRRTGARLVLSDVDRAAVESESAGRLASEVGEEDLAYVIFTSGSTGKPKGVQIPHGAVVGFLGAMLKQPGFSRDDVLLAVTTVAFDIAVLELLLPLVAGGCTVIASREVVADGSRLAREIAASGATVLQATPSGWRVLIEAGWQGDGRLRMLCGGEALPRSLADELLRRGGSLWNVYGPTEATVWCSMERIGDGEGPVTIGRPIANMTLYVLDRFLQPVPEGVPGQLYIAGMGLARGYLGQPGLTAAAFLPDPFSREPGARMYASGDLARRRPGGALECLGRLDRQVKIRGFRIELEEIELALQEHPAVRETAVLLQARDGDARLAAWVCGNLDPASAAPELREFLRRKLPDYMVPTVLSVLDELPHTPSGKVDRRRLAVLEASGQEPVDLVRPRTRLELELVRLWEEILGVRPVGARDDFFHLGGHSLLAIRLVSRIRDRFGIDLPLMALFQGATIERVAELLRQGGGSANASPVAALQPRGSLPPFFCVHPAGGGVLCYLELAQELGEDWPFYGLQARGWEGEEEPLRRVEEMARSYLEALRAVQPEGPYFLGGWSFGGLVAFEMARQLEGRGEAVALLALLDTGVPGGGPLPDDAGIISNFLTAMGFPIPAEELRGQGETSRQIAYVIERARAEGVLPADFDVVRAQKYFEVSRANLEAALAYAPRNYAGTLTLFRTLEEGEDPTLGWHAWAAGVDMHEVPGRHADMIWKPHASVLAARLRDCLERARQAIGLRAEEESWIS